MGHSSSNVANFRTKVVSTTITMPGSEYATGDLLVEEIAIAVGNGHTIGTINNAVIVDQADFGVQLEFWFSDSQTAPSFGTPDAVPDVSDANAATLVGMIDSSATYTDLNDNKVAIPAAFSPIHFDTLNGQLYAAIILRGAATNYGGGTVVLRLGLTIEKGV